ncbi:response regulator [Tichowtungia aerotolerans]|uniref:Response regulator n=1 Tax=Tichowtungia aerotolerans TaxID=2697043 RepID=A0A6P1LZI5_9BACT|nr:response regulator transcription factor [Tichowtungia aerotolerans]QHI67949.1 response regulator [Tichowtungia aerotolerans]
MKFTAENPAKILIVDDHAIVRYGMGVLLAGANDLTLCGEAENIDEAIKAVQELKPDAAVIDIVLKDENGLDLIRKLRSNGEKLPLLVMSMHNESTHAEKALRAGAQGYIMKEDADEVLVEALRTVLSGKLHVSDGIHEKMLRSYIQGDEEPEQDGIESLTAREKEVFEGVGKGLTSKEIAEKFHLSPRTVEVHRANIKKKLQCDSAAQLLRMAVQWVEGQ